jgi:hypothetical protein
MRFFDRSLECRHIDFVQRSLVNDFIDWAAMVLLLFAT